MKSFLIALQFLTIIPVRINRIDKNGISKAVIYFPIVGLLLGLILTGTNNLFLFLNFEHFHINIILIVLLVFLTGGIHLDGLADTADALLSRKNKEEMLRIMRDSRIGAMGVLGLISIILLKIVFLSSIDVSIKPASLLLMCILSRWTLVLSMFLFRYARQEGKAKSFIQAANLKTFILSTVITIACVILFWKIQGLILLGIIALTAYAIGRFLNSKIGGVTGDTLGATNELIEVAVLFSICIVGRIIL